MLEGVVSVLLIFCWLECIKLSTECKRGQETEKVESTLFFSLWTKQACCKPLEELYNCPLARLVSGFAFEDQGCFWGCSFSFFGVWCQRHLEHKIVWTIVLAHLEHELSRIVLAIACSQTHHQSKISLRIRMRNSINRKTPFNWVNPDSRGKEFKHPLESAHWCPHRWDR